MAERIVIEITEKGANVVQGAFEKIIAKIDQVEAEASKASAALSSANTRAAASTKKLSQEFALAALAAQSLGLRGKGPMNEIEAAAAKLQAQIKRDTEAFQAFERSVDSAAAKSHKMAQATAIVNTAILQQNVTVGRGKQLLDAYGKELDESAVSGQRASVAAGGLRSALAAIGLSIGVREISQGFDAYTNLENKIKAVTDTSYEAAAAMKAVIETANANRQSIDATGTTFQRMTVATGEMGLSQEQVIEHTDTLQKMFALSGATGAEASGALVQLTQALGAGALRGEEFNSVNEAGGLLMRQIAKEMKVSRGELKGLAGDGKITSDILIRAMENMRGEMVDKFGKMTPTIEAQWQVLKTSVVTFLGEMNKSTNIVKKVTDALAFLAEHVDGLFSALKVVAFFLAGTWVHSVLKADGALRTWWATWKVSPVGAAIAALIALNELVDSFKDETDLAVEAMADQIDKAEKLNANFVEQLALMGRAKIAIEGMRKGTEALTAATHQLLLIGYKMARQREAEMDVVIGANKLYLDLQNKTRAATTGLTILTSSHKDAAKKIKEHTKAAKGLQETYTNFEDVEELPWDKFFHAKEEAISLKRIELTEGKLEAEIQREILALGLKDIAQTDERIVKVREYVTELHNLNEAEGKRKENAKELEDLTKRFLDQQKKKAEAAKKAAKEEDKAAKNLPFNNIASQIKSTQEIMEDFTNNAVNGLSDAIADFAINGKKSFGDFAKALLADMTRLMIQQTLMRALFGNFNMGQSGSSGGGAAEFAGGLLGAVGRGLGGLATGGQFTVPGSGSPDSKLVAFKASPGEKITVNTPSQSARFQPGDRGGPQGAGGNTIVRNINVFSPEEAIRQQLATPAGEKMVMNIVHKNANGLKRSLGVR